MSNQEINLAIARVMGWTEEKIYARLDYDLALRQMQNAEIKEEEFYRRHLRVDPVPEHWPNYAGDLNAMHEVEKYFDDKIVDIQSLYHDYLSLECGWNAKTPAEAKWESSWNCLRSTARQRAVAFVKTLGKWRDQ